MDLLEKLSIVPIIVILFVIALFLVFLFFYIKPGFQVIGWLTNSTKKNQTIRTRSDQGKTHN